MERQGGLLAGKNGKANCEIRPLEQRESFLEKHRLGVVHHKGHY